MLQQLAEHPSYIGGKVSTLNAPHFLYWAGMLEGFASFTPYSGDDFGIATAIQMDLPLLIGAGASATPLITRAKAMWGSAPFDARVLKLFEAIQSLEDSVFRFDRTGSCAAYKHSTAHVQHLLGLISTPEPHPEAPQLRGTDETERMLEAMARPLALAEQLSIDGFQLG